MKTPQITFEAIGTHWIIEIFSPLDDGDEEKLQQSILERIDAFDKNYSRFRADSLVTRMSHTAGRFELPIDAKPMMDLYQKLYNISDGSITPLIGQTMEQAGYDAQYTLQPGELTTPPAWDDVLNYDFPHLTLKQPALLDFGAAGKGYLVDIVAQLLDDRGIEAYSINAGGDIVCRTPGDATIAVALEHPGNPEMGIGIAHVRNQSLCGSSGNRRAWGDFHHIINPHTLESPKHIAAAWVVADTGLVADGLTTALFFITPDILREHFEFEYAIVRADMRLDRSSNFPADFFTSNEHEKLN